MIFINYCSDLHSHISRLCCTFLIGSSILYSIGLFLINREGIVMPIWIAGSVLAVWMMTILEREKSEFSLERWIKKESPTLIPYYSIKLKDGLQKERVRLFFGVILSIIAFGLLFVIKNTQGWVFLVFWILLFSTYARAFVCCTWLTSLVIGFVLQAESLIAFSMVILLSIITVYIFLILESYFSLHSNFYRRRKKMYRRWRLFSVIQRGMATICLRTNVLRRLFKS